jgi:phage gpG-like protein
MPVEFTVVFNHLPIAVGQMRQEAGMLVQKTALDIEGDIKNEMRQAKSGRSYLRGGRRHVASAPGEAPAVDYGRLINSVQTTQVGSLTSEINTNVEYAASLEFGTRKIAPRPAWRPAFEKMTKPFRQAVEQLFNRWRS